MDIQYFISMCQHVVSNKLLRKPIRLHAEYKKHIEQKKGIEMGGPSKIFSRMGQFPVYPFAASIDNCNFSEETVWAKHDNQFFIQDNIELGQQFICEASEFNISASNRRYDFLLASHILEHIANPIKALMSWCELITHEGMMIIVLPNARYTFDRMRRPTEFKHLLNDYQKNVDECDVSHVDEIIEHHDYTRDYLTKNKKSFRQRALLNYQNRCLHHHVFDDNNLLELFSYCNLNVLSAYKSYPFHMYYIVSKK